MATFLDEYEVVQKEVFNTRNEWLYILSLNFEKEGSIQNREEKSGMQPLELLFHDADPVTLKIGHLEVPF
jgi:hypothetical protein